MIFLVEERTNPTTDYFLRSRFVGSPVRRFGFYDLPEPDSLNGAVVIFVRYVPSGWRRLVARERSRLRELIYFMDDDLLDASAAIGMPWRYRLKLARLATRHKQWLMNQGACLWVSTPYLQQKYAAWPARLLQPTPMIEVQETCRIFYHGSASHAAEIRWLKPVMEVVLQQDERVHFEIIGGGDVYRLYRTLPRVTVVHPMPWPAYQGFLEMGGRHIGLAPLVDGAFNRARSYTKFFDITRGGAVGVYAAEGAYGDVVRHGENGLLASSKPEEWIDLLLSLVRDEVRRKRMVQAAQRTVKSLVLDAEHNASLPDELQDWAR